MGEQTAEIREVALKDLEERVGNLESLVELLSSKVELLELLNERTHVAYGLKDPDGKIWSTGVCSFSDWVNRKISEPSTHRLVGPVTEDVAGEVAAKFGELADARSGEA